MPKKVRILTKVKSGPNGGTGDLGTKDGTKLDYPAHMIYNGSKIIGSVDCIVLWNMSGISL